MSTYNPKYIEKWVSHLNDKDRDMARIAAQKLAVTRDPAVVPPLLAAIQNNRPDDIRLEAARALGEIGDASAVPGLIALLREDNPTLASAAAESLGKIGDVKAVPALIQILREYKTKNTTRHSQLHGSARGVFLKAADALQLIGTPEALRAVKEYTSA